MVLRRVVVTGLGALTPIGNNIEVRHHLYIYVRRVPLLLYTLV